MVGVYGWLAVLLLVVPGGCFVIPRADFEVLHPRGLRVSIPDVAGIRLFSFHGALNEAIQVNQQGTINGEVTEAKDGRWTFTDPRVIIKGDDVINYWIYVQFNNLGYHMENKQLVIEASNSTLESESTSSDCPCSTTVHHHYHYHYYSLPDGSTRNANDSLPNQENAPCAEKLSNLEVNIKQTRDVADYLEAQLPTLQTELKMLQDMVNFVQNSQKSADNSKELLLLGSFPANIPNVMEYLQRLLRQKLSINNIGSRILSAHHPTDGEIVFEVSSMADKDFLLRKAKQKKLIEEGYILTNNPSDP